MGVRQATFLDYDGFVEKFKPREREMQRLLSSRADGAGDTKNKGGRVE